MVRTILASQYHKPNSRLPVRVPIMLLTQVRISGNLTTVHQRWFERFLHINITSSLRPLSHFLEYQESLHVFTSPAKSYRLVFGARGEFLNLFEVAGFCS